MLSSCDKSKFDSRFKLNISDAGDVVFPFGATASASAVPIFLIPKPGLLSII